MRLNKSICGCSLQTGSVAIGIFYGVLGVVLAIVSFVGLSQLQTEDEVMREVLKILLIIVGVMMLLQVCVCVPLVYGALKERPRFTVPWIIHAIVNLLLYKVSIVLYFIRLGLETQLPVWILLCQVIQAAILFYCFLVVSSYRKDLLEKPAGHDQTVLTGPRSNIGYVGFGNEASIT